MFTHCPPKIIPDLQSQTFPDGKRYYVTPKGTKLPSVTTVVGAMKKQHILEWRNKVGEEEANRVSRAASGRGNQVHNLAERYLRNETIDWRKEMPDASAMFHSIAKEFKHINNIHYLEQALWSEGIGLAGRVDLIAEWDGKLSVIDFKTSSKNTALVPKQCLSFTTSMRKLKMANSWSLWVPQVAANRPSCAWWLALKRSQAATSPLAIVW